MIRSKMMKDGSGEERCRKEVVEDERCSFEIIESRECRKARRKSERRKRDMMIFVVERKPSESCGV